MTHTLCSRLLLAAAAVAAAMTTPLPVGASPASTPSNSASTAPAAQNQGVERLVEKAGSIKTADGVLNYTEKAGTLVVRNEQGQPQAELFYMAYELKDADPKKRPVTFIWDGGPGGSTMFMNVQGFGPQRYSTAGNPGGRPPFNTAPNPDTLLRQSDLVFIDLIGTGYSRALAPAQNSEFWGVDSDANVTVAAIERYLALTDRWQSPKFILGNSYGTTRASVVAHRLQGSGIALNGVVLVASALNFGVFSYGMDHQFVVNLPTMAALAWYHKKTAHQDQALPDFLAEVQTYARTKYAEALFLGDALTAEQRTQVAQTLSGYLGLEPAYLERAHLRVSTVRFRKELLRSQGKTLGRLDGRVLSTDFDHAGEEPEGDPSLVTGILIPTNTLLRERLAQLGYHDDTQYILNNSQAAAAWNWTHAVPPTAGLSERELSDVNIFPQNTWAAGDLAAAMRANRNLQVLQVHGYYDLATPYAWADYDLAHMSLDQSLRRNIHTRYYESGHTPFADDASMKQMAQDLDAFYRQATAPSP